MKTRSKSVQNWPRYKGQICKIWLQEYEGYFGQGTNLRSLEGSHLRRIQTLTANSSSVIVARAAKFSGTIHILGY